MNRREFVNYTGGFMSLGLGGIKPDISKMENIMQPSVPIKIKNVDSNFERETLHPYRFKGSAITEAWQTAAMLESESGNQNYRVRYPKYIVVRFESVCRTFSEWWQCIDVCNE